MDLRAAKNAIGSPDDFEGINGYWRERALATFLRTWQPAWAMWYDREQAAASMKRNLKAAMREELRQEYGSVILTILITTLISTAISWLIQRILNHFWPPKPPAGCRGDKQFIAAMSEFCGRS